MGTCSVSLSIHMRRIRSSAGAVSETPGLASGGCVWGRGLHQAAALWMLCLSLAAGSNAPFRCSFSQLWTTDHLLMSTLPPSLGFPSLHRHQPAHPLVSYFLLYPSEGLCSLSLLPTAVKTREGMELKPKLQTFPRAGRGGELPQGLPGKFSHTLHPLRIRPLPYTLCTKR